MLCLEKQWHFIFTYNLDVNQLYWSKWEMKFYEILGWAAPCYLLSFLYHMEYFASWMFNKYMVKKWTFENHCFTDIKDS